jgi:DNA-binding transcriptional regulator YhcF (GntR family)
MVMEFAVDHALPVALGVQLRGLIEYGVACGQLMPGDRLPSVRDMATRLGIAPMTVSNVYAGLQEAGLIEAHRGQGTFVSRAAAGFARPQLAALQRRVDELIGAAAAEGIGTAELARLFNARLHRSQTTGRALRIVFVGVFVEATRAYVAEIQRRLPRGDTLTGTTLDEFARNDVARQRALSADLIVTFPNRKAEVVDLMGSDRRVVTIRFIPADHTRAALATIDPRARLAVISTFPEFLPIMKAGVQQFAPHVRRLEATVLQSPDLKAVLRRVDAVVYASGSERVRRMIKPGIPAFEYRHAPDPHEIDEVLLPALEELRAGALSRKASAAG